MAGGYYNGRATMSIPLTSLLQPDQADDRTVTNHHGKKSITYKDAGRGAGLFGKSVNPISTRVEDYAHQITTPPTLFQIF